MQLAASSAVSVPLKALGAMAIFPIRRGICRPIFIQRHSSALHRLPILLRPHF
jgi:hypothetical protein